MFILRHERIISQGHQCDAKTFVDTFFPHPAANYQAIMELEKRLAEEAGWKRQVTQALEEAGIVVPRPPSTSGPAALLPTGTTGGGGDEQSGAPQEGAKNGSPPTAYYPERAEERTSTASVAGRLRRRTRSQLLSGRDVGDLPPHNYGSVQGTAPRAPLIDREQGADPPEHF